MAARWVTFDCYGTLIDWNGGIRAELERVFGSDEPTAEPAEGGEAEDERIHALLARYHRVERELQKDRSLTYRAVMTRAMQELGAPAGLEAGLAESLPSWQPFPEVPAALAEIRERGWRLAILSNSDTDLIESSKRLLGVPFDETVVASEIKSYKPAPHHWLEFYARTLADRRRHVHVGASLFHDIAPAARLRIPNVWINRLEEHPGPSPSRELTDLSGLPDTLDELMPA